MAQLNLELPESYYKALEQTARDERRTPEEVATDWLQASIRRIVADPLLQLTGSIETDVADVGTRHDEIIGEGLHRDPRARHDA
jgi:hypothetical protein